MVKRSSEDNAQPILDQFVSGFIIGMVWQKDLEARFQLTVASMQASYIAIDRLHCTMVAEGKDSAVSCSATAQSNTTPTRIQVVIARKAGLDDWWTKA